MPTVQPTGFKLNSKIGLQNYLKSTTLTVIGLLAVVSMLVFYYDNLSSNPAKVCYYCVKIAKKNKNKKEAVNGPFLKSLMFLQ